MRPLAIALVIALSAGACGLDGAGVPGAGPPESSGPANAGAPDAGAGPADGGAHFTVVTWNVKNLFDEVNDPWKDDDVPTAAQVKAKLDQIGEVLRPLAPDVLALQEVENAGILDRLVDGQLSSLGLAHRRLVEAYDPRGIDVALATRVPITLAVSHALLDEQFYSPEGYGPYRWSRDCLEVHMDVGSRTLVALVVHQISHSSGSLENERKRQAQALKTRQIADALRAEDPQRLIVIVGDMNDDPDSVSMRQYTTGGTWIDVALDVPAHERWTYAYLGRLHRYDYILADVATAAWRTRVSIPHFGAPYPSDHAPVTATFAVP